MRLIFYEVAIIFIYDSGPEQKFTLVLRKSSKSNKIVHNKVKKKRKKKMSMKICNKSKWLNSSCRKSVYG